MSAAEGGSMTKADTADPHRVRRQLALGSSAFVLGVALTACSSSGNGSGGGAATTAAAGSSSIAAPASTVSSAATGYVAPSSASAGGGGAPANATQAKADIVRAYGLFFNATSNITQSQGALQHGAVFHAALVAQGKGQYANKSSAKVDSITFTSPKVAAVKFTILNNGSPLINGAPGNAVLENGSWKVAAQTFCSLLKLAGDAPKACDDPTITALPR